jgi:hypothetical protein
LEVAALNSPPNESTTSEIALAEGRFLLPLNTMCSKKCEIPLILFSSNREPVLTQIVTVADSKEGIGAVKTLSPEERVDNLQFITRYYCTPIQDRSKLI